MLVNIRWAEGAPGAAGASWLRSRHASQGARARDAPSLVPLPGAPARAGVGGKPIGVGR